MCVEFNHIQNYLAQKWPEKNIRFSKIFHSGKTKPAVPLIINRSKDGARGYLIHAITVSYADPTLGPAGIITINGELIFAYSNTVALNNAITHNFYHYHDGTQMRFDQNDNKLVYVVHYQYITFGNEKKK